MINYELTLEGYQGPMEKLLELIQEKKLEITSMSLATVTGDFLTYLETLKTREEGDKEYTALVADFLVVASRLILIKSKALLPQLELTEEEEGDIHDLETRLKLYQEFKDAREHLKRDWREMPQFYSREFLSSIKPIFYPPQHIHPEDLSTSLIRVMGELEKILKPKGVIQKEIINLKQKIEVISNFFS